MATENTNTGNGETSSPSRKRKSQKLTSRSPRIIDLLLQDGSTIKLFPGKTVDVPNPDKEVLNRFIKEGTILVATS